MKTCMAYANKHNILTQMQTMKTSYGICNQKTAYVIVIQRKFTKKSL